MLKVEQQKCFDRANAETTDNTAQFNLETNGDLSILTKKDSKVVHPEPLILDGQINQDVLKQLNYSPEKLKQELKSQHVEIEDVFYCVLEKQGLFFIKK